MSGAQYNATAPTVADGKTIVLQADASGNLKTVSSGSGTTAAQVQGTAATGAAVVGNPLQNGGKIINAQGLVVDGTAHPLSLTTYGALRVQLFADGGIGTIAPTVLNGDAVGAGIFGLNVASFGMVTNAAGTWDRMRGDANGVSVSKGLVSTRWRYTSGASPILSNTTTAVTIKTAGGAGVKNVIDSIQLTTTAFTASVPLAIRDGASGTVMWALTVPTSGFLQPVTIVFEQPIAGTANTLLEVVTTTANTAGTVTLNVQGHTET